MFAREKTLSEVRAALRLRRPVRLLVLEGQAGRRPEPHSARSTPTASARVPRSICDSTGQAAVTDTSLRFAAGTTLCGPREIAQPLIEHAIELGVLFGIPVARMALFACTSRFSLASHNSLVFLRLTIRGLRAHVAERLDPGIPLDRILLDLREDLRGRELGGVRADAVVLVTRRREGPGNLQQIDFLRPASPRRRGAVPSPHPSSALFRRPVRRVK